MRRATAFIFAAMLATVGCGGEGSDDSSSSNPTAPSGSAGTLNLRITDSPYGSAKAVLVTFSEVAAHRDGDWTRLPFADGTTTTWTCDLKKLQNSAQDLLGTGALTAGHYTMIRLVVQSARIYFDNPAVSPTPCARAITAPAGASFPLTIPSGEVKLNGSYTLTAGGATTVLVDFDGEQSIRETGNSNYMMTPVIRLVSVQ